MGTKGAPCPVEAGAVPSSPHQPRGCPRLPCSLEPCAQTAHAASSIATVPCAAVVRARRGHWQKPKAGLCALVSPLHTLSSKVWLEVPMPADLLS